MSIFAYFLPFYLLKYKICESDRGGAFHAHCCSYRDARIVPSANFYIRVGHRFEIDGTLLECDRRRGLERRAEHDRHPRRDSAEDSAV